MSDDLHQSSRYSSKEKWFIFFSMLCAFGICGEYAITRPASNVLFLNLFSAKFYSWAWLATVPLNLVVVLLYNRFLPKMGPLRFLWTFAFASIAINFLAATLYPIFPYFIFFQYAWKDIYVLLMLKQLWSMIHSTISSSRAKYLYGSIYGVGTIGAVIGSAIPGFWAGSLGSETLLFFTLPVYSFVIFVYTMALKNSGVNADTFEKELTEDPRPKEAFSLIKKSPVLIAVLGLVIFMQASVALMEYQFNAHLELNILEKDLRTAYCGKLMGLVNLFSLILQFLGSLFVIRFLGLRGSHFLVPILLALSAVTCVIVPSFAMISAAYVFLKGLEFSLFGVIREMLYIPLELDAKYRAKAVIDVFAYRTSKALVALGLLFLQAIATSFLLPLAGYASIALFAFWFGTVLFFFRRKSIPNQKVIT